MVRNIYLIRKTLDRKLYDYQQSKTIDTSELLKIIESNDFSEHSYSQLKIVDVDKVTDVTTKVLASCIKTLSKKRSASNFPSFKYKLLRLIEDYA